VLAEKGLRAIGKIVLRDREQLAAIDPFASTMLLSTLYWPDEVRSTAELALPEAEVEIKPAERVMAEQLVAAMTADFDASAYHDQYREALMDIIEAKAAGAEIAEPAPEPAAKLTDLMAALEASVAAAKATRKEAAAESEPEEMTAAAGKRAARKAVPIAVPGSKAVPVGSGASDSDAEAEGSAAAAPVRRRKTA
jgi:DNA end-binding protein Ku